jgi:hypothetical protein
MKFQETHFEEYIHAFSRGNLHPKLEKIYKKFPAKIKDLKNIIFYGPSGVGKYSQMLKSIQKYSPSDLKYEKKINVNYNKIQYFFKISDIHYEIDMSLLGCNSKVLWHEIYLQIVDSISAKSENTGIIVCKYFNEIHSELLDNFYSYMQQNRASVIDLKFILITEELSFIPENILNCCEVIHVARPTKTIYNKCGIKMDKTVNLENITNIKTIRSSCISEPIMTPYKIICDKVIDAMINIDDLQFLKFRDLLYDIFIYNLDISDCVWYIMSSLIEKKKIQNKHKSELLIKIYHFFQYYNNNYRPICHLESFMFYLTTIIHGYDIQQKLL